MEIYYVPYFFFGAFLFAIRVNTLGAYVVRQPMFTTAEHVVLVAVFVVLWELAVRFLPTAALSCIWPVATMVACCLGTTIGFDQFNKMPTLQAGA